MLTLRPAILLTLIFSTSACLRAQNLCPPLSFSVTKEIQMTTDTTDTAMVRQPDGSYYAVTLQMGSFTPEALFANYQKVLLAGCGSGTPTQTIPHLPDNAPALGVGSQILAVADFQGIGIPSAAFVADTSQAVVNYGQFSLITGVSITSYPTSSPVSAVAAADLNNDGKYDFVAVVGGDYTAQNPGGVQIFLGNGNGTFKTGASYVTGVAAANVTIADVNKDGKLDLIVCGPGSSAITVLLGNGDGTFTPAAAHPIAGMGPYGVIAADFNGDQKVDLAVSNVNGNTISIFLGNGDGTFQTPTSFPAQDCTFLAAADFDHDGHLDLALTNQGSGLVAIALGKGDGTFGPSAFYAAGDFPTTLIVTDFNNDGKLDILTGTGTPDYIGANFNTRALDLLLGNGDGTFQGTRLLPAGKTSHGLTIADFNGDGTPDIVVANQGSGDLTVFIGQGGGSFQAKPSSANTSGFAGPVSVASADFNHDGKMDVATALQSSGSVAISLGNGDGSFQAPVVLAAGTAPSWVAAGDLNGDGKPDLVVGDQGGQGGVADVGGVWVFLSNGSTFQAGRKYGAGAYPSSVVIRDVNLDGKPDLVVSDYGFGSLVQGGVSILLGNGDGTFAPAATTTIGSFDTSVVVGDWNLDGKPDLVLAGLDNNFEDVAVIFIGKGDGTFIPSNGILVSQPIADIITGDFNGDGFPDLVLANCCGEVNMSYLLGNGNGSFQAETLFNGGPNPEFVASIDFNGDGKPDLAIANAPASAGALTILLNETPNPPVHVTPAAGTTPQSAVTGSAFGVALGVTVSDKNNQPVAGVTVSFTAPSTGASGTFAGGSATFVATTDSTGAATASVFTANSTAGTYSVTATAGSLPGIGFALTNTAASTHPAFFTGEGFLSGTAYYLQFPDGNPFGYYEYLSSSILYHFDMGFEAYIAGTGNQIYFYDFTTGHWWYTSASLFPYLYDFTLNTFIYYFPDTKNAGHYTTNPRYFSNLTTSTIFTM